MGPNIEPCRMPNFNQIKMFNHSIKLVQLYKKMYKNKLSHEYYYKTECNKVYMLPNNIQVLL